MGLLLFSIIAVIWLTLAAGECPNGSSNSFCHSCKSSRFDVFRHSFLFLFLFLKIKDAALMERVPCTICAFAGEIGWAMIVRSVSGPCVVQWSNSILPELIVIDSLVGMCQFGTAHVDSPKGDLDGSGKISGPGKTIIPNNVMYPYGTTEQYPAVTNSDGTVLKNTAHAYMECSNKVRMHF